MMSRPLLPQCRSCWRWAERGRQSLHLERRLARPAHRLPFHSLPMKRSHAVIHHGAIRSSRSPLPRIREEKRHRLFERAAFLKPRLLSQSFVDNHAANGNPSRGCRLVADSRIVRVRIIIASVPPVDPLDIGAGSDGNGRACRYRSRSCARRRVAENEDSFCGHSVCGYSRNTYGGRHDGRSGGANDAANYDHSHHRPGHDSDALPVTIANLFALAIAATRTAALVIAHRCDNFLDGSQCFERCPKSAVRVRRAYGKKPQNARYRRETDGCPNGHLIFPCSTVPSPHKLSV